MLHKGLLPLVLEASSKRFASYRHVDVHSAVTVISSACRQARIVLNKTRECINVIVTYLVCYHYKKIKYLTLS